MGLAESCGCPFEADIGSMFEIINCVMRGTYKYVEHSL